jgi:hypothetical protein
LEGRRWKKCKVCKTPFLWNDANKSYCSPDCRMRKGA